MNALINSIIAVYPIIIVGLFVFCLLIALPRYFLTGFGMRPEKPFLRTLLYRRSLAPYKNETSIANILKTVIIAFILSRALIWLIGLLGYALNDNISGYLNRQSFIWKQWDAPHYLGIAENGYVTEGDARYHIVFYPLYPFLVRLFSYVTGNTAFSAYFLSNLFLILSGFMLFRFVEYTYGVSTAKWTVWIFMFSPCGMFFSIPYTESLFFLLTISSVYFARKHEFTIALILGALSSFTRMPGVICAVPIFYEMLRSRRRSIRSIADKQEKILTGIRCTAVSFAKCLFVLAGLIGYLAVNQIITGDPFTFLVHQKEHWHQTMGSIYNTASYTIKYLFYPNVDWYQYGIWIPQTACLLLTLILMAFNARKLRPGDIAYSVVYFFVVISPTMLLSGSRYLLTMYPIFPMLANAMRNKYARIITFILYLAFYLYAVWMYTVEHIFL
ncbi:MAG: glycosyltransferase family 39 protein [Clostridia bacterium]|nr:glycosyltransferase family 39 protein [Clostridia bacterium]